MTLCHFVSDLHGKVERYERLKDAVLSEKPSVLFMSGDILTSALIGNRAGNFDYNNFVKKFLSEWSGEIRERLGEDRPEIFLILGNDDGDCSVSHLEERDGELWHYMHKRTLPFKDFRVLGYNCVPFGPSSVKDWEMFDFSRYSDNENWVPDANYSALGYREGYPSMKQDLEGLTEFEKDISRLIFVSHCPPYDTCLDLWDPGQKMLAQGVPYDRHIGSIAIKRFIEEKQPYLTLHGHAHSSTRLSGSFIEKIGSTYCMNGATDQYEKLCLVRFELEDPAGASRELL